MADVFISYSKSHVVLTRELAHALEAKGLTVWWDTELLAGESFRERIIQELKACKAAIVIWTPHSIQSPYVVSEAERARVAGKLIQVRTHDVEPTELPPPFDTRHACLIDDRNAIFRSLSKLVLLQSDATAGSKPFLLEPESDEKTWWRRSKRKLLIGGAAIVVISGVLAAANWPRERATAAYPRSSISTHMTDRAAIVADRFLNQVNAGFSDSTIFDANLRLGRRGLLSKIDALNELRKLQSKYTKISCRMEGEKPTLTRAGFSQNGFRVVVQTECDFTLQSGLSTTERFPFEIEATPGLGGALLISGLWHPGTMWFWQPKERD